MARTESGELSCRITHLYELDSKLVYDNEFLACTYIHAGRGIYMYLSLLHARTRMPSCSPLHRARGVRTCVSTCESAMCLHARRQRHTMPHTGNSVCLSASAASRPARSPLHLASLTYDTIRARHKAGRQVAHKTKELRREGREVRQCR